MASVVDAYRSADLSNAQLALDDQAMEIAEQREASMASRRSLAKETERFATSNPSEMSSIGESDWRALLQRYQQEVNELARRSSRAEDCFLAAYRLVRSLPDPTEVLTIVQRGDDRRSVDAIASAAKVEDAEREAQRWRGAAEKYLSQLRDAEKRERAAEEDREEWELDLRNKLAAEYDVRTRGLQEQLLESREASEREIASLNAALDVSNEEVARLGESILKTTNESSSPSQETEERRRAAREAAKDAEIAALSLKCKSAADETDVLRARVQFLGSALEERSAEADAREAHLKHELSQMSEQVHRYREELDSRATAQDSDKLRAEIAVLRRSLQSSASKEGMNTSKEAKEEEEEEEGKDGYFDLENWLVGRCDALKMQLQSAKDAQKEQTEAEASLRADLESRQSKIDALEDRVSDLQSKLDAAERSNDFSIAGASSSAPKIASKGSSSSSASSAKMLRLVFAQRDELQSKVEIMARDLEKTQRNAQETQRRCSALQKDNVELYARVRFLSSYKASERSTLLHATAASTSPDAPDDIESGSAENLLGRGVSHKYRTLYEQENIATSTPWGRFKEGERQRAAANAAATLPFLESTLLRAASFTMSNQRRRWGLIYYLGIVHLAMIIALAV